MSGEEPDLKLVEQVRRRLAGLARDWTPMDVAHAILDCGRVASDKTVLAVVEELRRTSTGAGRLDPLLAMDGVTDVLVNGPNQVFIDRGQGLELTDVTFSGPEEVRALAVRLAAAVGRRLDDGNPWVDARLPDGIRVHAVLDVLARPGTCLSLRVPSRRCLSLDDWVTGGSMAPGCRRMIDTILSRKLAFLVTGGTGTGKTTLLSAMLTSLPSDQRLVIVEDSREIWIDHPHWVSMEARAANSEGKGSVTLTDLVRQCLRMRPDRIVLGEVRGAELRDLLMALNTGHEGGCGTVHANGVAEVPARLEALAALGGLSREAASAQITAALHTVIHVERGERGTTGGGDWGFRRCRGSSCGPTRRAVGCRRRDDSWRRCGEVVTVARNGGGAMTVIGASLLMGLAVWIAMPSATRKQEGRHLPAWSGIPVGFVVAWLLFGASGVVWAVMTVVVGETVLVVVRRQRRRAQILKGGREVARATRALAGRVSVGEIPSVALEHVADDVEVLAQARRAQAVGGSVSDALIATSRQPGMAGLVPLAHAWHLAATTGAPLAPAAKSVAEGTARRARLEATLDSELAAARASGRIMGLLPLVGLLMGHVVGAHPMVFLTTTWLGRACLLGSTLLACVGVLWSESLADRVAKEALP